MTKRFQIEVESGEILSFERRRSRHSGGGRGHGLEIEVRRREFDGPDLVTNAVNLFKEPPPCLSGASRRCERAHDAPTKSIFLSIMALCDWVNNTNLLSTGEGDSSPNIKITSTARILNVASCHHRLKGLNEGGSGVFELFEIRVSTLRLEEGILGSVFAQPGLRGRSLSGLVSVSQRKVLVQAVG
ncbi:hypothetical protein F2Q69_00033182 [Brassica cretica]|uniref:Uncharacterized protein n=1 Tax=Brassica cretica TaxID=69181 RepID=A0A8S9SD42_BRACR|nr:hypothetical protein F2Q69_00033182 [Brassica cretica]